MMQSVYRVLEEGYRKYPKNPIFLIIKDLASPLNQIPSLMDLYVSVSQNKPLETSVTIHTSLATNADHRIKHLIVSSFKAFDSDAMYGIDFRDSYNNPIPSSTIILGSNGIGKTSAYTALEVVAMRHSYVAEVFGYPSLSAQLEYIKNNNNGTPNPFASIIDSTGRQISYPRENTELCPPSFFCSQFDFQDYISRNFNFDYILHQLGRTSVKKLLDVLAELKFIVESLNQINLLSINLKSEQPKAKEIKDKEIKRLRRDVKERLGFRDTRFVNSKWVDINLVNNITQVVQYLENDLNKILDEFYHISSDLIPNVLNEYLKEDDIHIEIRRTDKTITPVVIISNSSDGIPPKLWFNTFRMKLFIVAIKMSLAFTSKIIDKLNFPIIMDDIFDSSDFKNKFEISYFFHSIVLGHNKFALLNQMPLQLICFTQDRLVADNVYKGICIASSDVPVKYCRMYHFKECTEDDLVKCTPNSTDEYYNVTQLIASSR